MGQRGEGGRPVEGLERRQPVSRRFDQPAQAVGDADLAVVEGDQIDGTFLGQERGARSDRPILHPHLLALAQRGDPIQGQRRVDAEQLSGSACASSVAGR